MIIDKRLLEIICCPETHQSLRELDDDKIKTLNRRIRSGRVRYRDDTQVTEELHAALVTEDKSTIYAVSDGIPILLIDQQISADQLD